VRSVLARRVSILGLSMSEYALARWGRWGATVPYGHSGHSGQSWQSWQLPRRAAWLAADPDRRCKTEPEPERCTGWLEVVELISPLLPPFQCRLKPS
jgi:hypothetical protein